MAQKRRENGEGQLFQRKSGKEAGKTIYRIPVGRKENGDVQYRETSGHTKEEALEKGGKIKAEVITGSYIEPDKILFGDYLEVCIASKIDAKETTLTLYRSLINRHILPGLGGFQVQKLQKNIIRDFYSKKKSELSASSVHDHAKVIHQALDLVVEDNIIFVNPAHKIRLPKIKRKEMQVYNVDQVKTLLKVAYGWNMQMYTMLMLDIWAGLRRGETMGLRWADVDLKYGFINVRQQVVNIKGKAVITDLKTESSRRTVSVPEEVIAAFKQYRKSLSIIGKLVFTNEQGGLIRPNTYYNRLHQLCKMSYLPIIRIHDVRHTFASLYLEAGVDLKSLQSDMGHTSIATTSIYTHLNKEMKKAATEKRKALLTGTT